MDIEEGDWVVHINTPEYGKCIAAKITSEYNFDEGLNCSWGADFRHFFEVDKSSIIEFDRNDKNILSSVNLYPRQRFHRIYKVDDFIESLKNLKLRKVSLVEGEEKGEFHLKTKTTPYLVEITKLIQEMHRSKNLEKFLAKVFRNISGVVDVKENGFGWGTDYGADLIVTTQSTIGNLVFDNKIVVQVKSFTGLHSDLSAADQVKTGIEKYDATAGIIITTAQRTEELENKIQKISSEIDKPISLLAGEDVAKFVIKNSSDLIFKLDLL